MHSFSQTFITVFIRLTFASSQSATGEVSPLKKKMVKTEKEGLIPSNSRFHHKENDGIGSRLAR